MDKASPHYKSRKVKNYLEQNKVTLIPMYLPTASHEFMMLEEVWNISKRHLLVLKYYTSFEDFKEKISMYFRTKRFNLDMRNYLLRMVRIYVKWYSIPLNSFPSRIEEISGISTRSGNPIILFA